MFSASSILPPAPHNPNRDYEVVSPPTDSISCLSFSPKANHLSAGSWDKKVYLWDVVCTPTQGSATPRGTITHDGPVLCTAWNGDGTKHYSAGCDAKAKCWDLASGSTYQVAQHGAAIKSMFWIEDMQTLVTGSWDKTIRYWDTRSPTPVYTLSLTDKVYAMDVLYPLAVVALADRSVVLGNLKSPTVEFRRNISPLKYQSRAVAFFCDRTGFALGSIEGRVAIHHVDEKDASSNFAFKCHRDNNEIYAVNSISFHPTYGTFATSGADGAFNFWDKDSKQRLKPFLRCNSPIPAALFNSDGSIYAYAVSYDWSKGSEFYVPGQPNHILLHPVTEIEIKPRSSRFKKRS
jgi:mRNA export factor